MKKFIIVFAACILASSCVNSVYQGFSFGNIENGILMEDGGFLQSPTNPAALKSFKEGARMYYLYNIAKEDTVNVTLTAVQELLVKDVINVSEMQDTLGDRSCIPYTADYSGGYLNLQFRYGYEENCREIINLTYDDVENQGDKLVFTLYHKRLDKDFQEVTKDGIVYDATGIICFPINKIVDARKGSKKILTYVIRFRDGYGEWHTSNDLPLRADAFVQKPLRNK